MDDVEEVLLSAHNLRTLSPKIRIFPDVPWSERQQKKDNPLTAKIVKDKKTVLIHGIPESQENDTIKRRAHDCREWKFIQELIGTKDVITTGLTRLPYSPNYKGTGPRILKVSVLQESMVTSLLETWYAKRRLAPPEVRLRPAETKLNTEKYNRKNDSLNATTSKCSTLANETENSPKNSQ